MTLLVAQLVAGRTLPGAETGVRPLRLDDDDLGLPVRPGDLVDLVEPPGSRLVAEPRVVTVEVRVGQFLDLVGRRRELVGDGVARGVLAELLAEVGPVAVRLGTLALDLFGERALFLGVLVVALGFPRALVRFVALVDQVLGFVLLVLGRGLFDLVLLVVGRFFGMRSSAASTWSAFFREYSPFLFGPS
jgi:hypothetical protein